MSVVKSGLIHGESIITLYCYDVRGSRNRFKPPILEGLHKVCTEHFLDLDVQSCLAIDWQ